MNCIKRIHLVTLVVFSFFTTTTIGQNVDVNILKSINPQNPNSQLWKLTSSSAYWGAAGVSFGTLAYGLIKGDKTAQHNACEIFISLGASALISEGLKYSFNRTRPADKYPNEVFDPSHTHGQSFPSGHTTLAFATATTLALDYKKWYITAPAFLWAGSVGYSRMYLGKHYPSDVLGGIIVGSGSSLLSHWLNKKIFKKEAAQKHAIVQ